MTCDCSLVCHLVSPILAIFQELDGGEGNPHDSFHAIRTLHLRHFTSENVARELGSATLIACQRPSLSLDLFPHWSYHLCRIDGHSSFREVKDLLSSGATPTSQGWRLSSTTSLWRYDLQQVSLEDRSDRFENLISSSIPALLCSFYLCSSA